MYTLRNWYHKERKILGPAVLCGVIFTLCFGWFTKAYSETTQTEIANDVIRFHVLANSDDPADQSLKLKVRDAVLEAFKDGLSASHSKEETKAFLQEHLYEIQKCAAGVVEANGYHYPVAVSVSHDFFPTKTYGDITFPPGDYEALRIVIGEGGGHNWWCVMFPPLCYVDVTKGKTSDAAKEQLKEAVGQTQYQLLSDKDRDEKVTVKVKFKVVEWWQNLFHKQKDLPPKQEAKPDSDGYVLKQ